MKQNGQDFTEGHVKESQHHLSLLELVTNFCYTQISHWVSKNLEIQHLSQLSSHLK